MRAGEICKSEWKNVHERHIHLPAAICKNRRSRDVPLSKKARALLEKRKTDSGLIFDIKSSSLDTQFRRYRDMAAVENATFHDTRHTALTRLAKIYENPMDLAKISGHRDLRQLLNTYYNPTIDDLADKLD